MVPIHAVTPPVPFGPSNPMSKDMTRIERAIDHEAEAELDALADAELAWRAGYPDPFDYTEMDALADQMEADTAAHPGRDFVVSAGAEPNEGVEPDFCDSEGALWRVNDKGNYCRYEDGSPPYGVVFACQAGWRGLSNIFEEARVTKGARDNPWDAAELLLEAEAEGPTSELWAPPNTTAWQPSKPKDGRPGYWRKRDGTVLSVRQCKPHPSGRYAASWTASLGPGDPVMNARGQPWHADAQQAMRAADAEYKRRSANGELFCERPDDLPAALWQTYSASRA